MRSSAKLPSYREEDRARTPAGSDVIILPSIEGCPGVKTVADPHKKAIRLMSIRRRALSMWGHRSAGRLGTVVSLLRIGATAAKHPHLTTTSASTVIHTWLDKQVKTRRALGHNGRRATAEHGGPRRGTAGRRGRMLLYAMECRGLCPLPVPLPFPI